MLGFAEQLEWIEQVKEDDLEIIGPKKNVRAVILKAARATCDFYIDNTPSDGIPYWDTGAPGLCKIDHYLDKPADPYNSFEPVDSSAAAIAAQGLLRLGHFLALHYGDHTGRPYREAGLRIIETLLSEPYLSQASDHQGLLLHSVYHRPNGWDYIHEGHKIPNGESCMWGDYHIREACLHLQRIINDGIYYTYFSCAK
jgi:unsaturated chondroitin disaccharide hydrolase